MALKKANNRVKTKTKSSNPSRGKKVSISLKGDKATTRKVAVKKQKSKKNIVKKKTVLKKTTKTKSLTKKSSLNKKTNSYKGEEAFLASIKPYKLNKKEKYMSAKQKNHFVKILERWEKMLQTEQERTADKIQNVSSHFADESDRATHEEGFTLEIRTRERERKLLLKIGRSLEDLNKGDYGFCNNPHCGVEIGIRRLEARPTAKLCIDCKTLEEITEKQQYG